MEKKITCLGCTHHYIYYSDKLNNYSITDSSSKPFDLSRYIPLEEENIPHLINLLQYYKKFMTDNKANLSEQLSFEECNNQVNYYSIKSLAKLAREINETAELNKKHLKIQK
ncbi:MAG: hypothetical protein PHS80_13985 [Methanothrix sp.]|nr:hypothetical protein [Methanothrix sp.]